MRILGIDYGEKRIGIAVSDPFQNIAHAVKFVDNPGTHGSCIKNITKILDEYSPIEEIVIGLPKTLRGEIGHKAKEVLEFVEAFKKCVSFPVKIWDERLSTVAAERPLKDAGISRKKRKKIVDASAAAFMLQGYLDSKKGGSE